MKVKYYSISHYKDTEGKSIDEVSMSCFYSKMFMLSKTIGRSEIKRNTPHDGSRCSSDIFRLKL